LQGKLAEALPFHEKAAQEAKRILGPTHPTTTAAERDYAALVETLKSPAPHRPGGP
jgi:hypothetical protein